MATEGGDAKKGSDAIAYKGSVSGLKGYLTNRITKIAGAVVHATESPLMGSTKIPVAMIFPNPEQPRQVFDPKSLEELAVTMKEVGQAQAITVRRKGNGYEIISGERRYRAARLAGLANLDCIVKDVSDNEAQLLSLVENLQRQDLLPIEEAHYLRKVLDENVGLSLEKLAKMLGSHKSTLSEKIQLTEVPAEEQKLLYARGKGFTHRHWRVLSRIKDPAHLKVMLKRSLEEQLSVSELERVLEEAGVPKARRIPATDRGPLKEWKAPIFVEQESFVLRGGTFNFGSLDPEKRERFAEQLRLILARLEAPPPVATPDELVHQEVKPPAELSF